MSDLCFRKLFGGNLIACLLCQAALSCLLFQKRRECHIWLGAAGRALCLQPSNVVLCTAASHTQSGPGAVIQYTRPVHKLL